VVSLLPSRPDRRLEGATRPSALAILAALTALTILAALAPLVGCRRREPAETFHGVRLGMTPGDVRARFQPPTTRAVATWRSVPGGEGMLEYSVPGGDAPKVRFEFHSGMLVAVRASLEPGDIASRGPRRDLNPGSVLVRAPREQGQGQGRTVEVTWLSRDCPTHKIEADRLSEP